MRKIEVVIGGESGEAVGAAMLSGIFSVIQSYGCLDVMVKTEAVQERDSRGLQVAECFTRQKPPVGKLAAARR